MTSIATSVPGAVLTAPVVEAQPSASDLTVSWRTPKDDGGLAIYAYVLEIHPVRDTSPGESGEDAAKRRSSALSSRIVVTDAAALRRGKTTVPGLISGMPYEVRVAAVNSAGTGIFSEYSAPVRTSLAAAVDASSGAKRPMVAQVSGKGGEGGASAASAVADAVANALASAPGSAAASENDGAASDVNTSSSASGAAAASAAAAAGGAALAMPRHPCFGPSVVLSDSQELLSINTGGAALHDAEVWASAFSPKTYDVTAEAVLAVPAEGHEPLRNADIVQDRIVIVLRGKVPLHVKVKHAQEAGALGVVIVDTGRCDAKFDQKCSQGADKSRGEGFAAEDDKGLWEKYHIPSVMVQRKHAKALGLPHRK